MKIISYTCILFAVGVIISSCRTLNTAQTTVVKKFAGTAKEASDMPFKILFNYYSIKFKRKQPIPENYVTGDSGKEELDQLAENVITRIQVASSLIQSLLPVPPISSQNHKEKR